MKLIFNETEYLADKIINKDSKIAGYDSLENEVFSFKGISDTSMFKLYDDEGNEKQFVKVETEAERIASIEATLLQLMMMGV